MNSPVTVTTASGSHVQGIAVDAERRYMYFSFTTCLIKTDMNGNLIGSVTGLAGHLGCIAYNYDDHKVYGSLEFKKDAIGRGILANLGSTQTLQDGFYIAVFDVEKITRMDMDAEKDGVMTAVYLKEVFEDYSAPGHRYGCSGIDGTTFAPAFGTADGKNYLYVAYGIYGDIEREDNNHQVILQYDISDWDKYAKPLNQADMHTCGPDSPDGKYFIYTGNTTYGIQNLEYDPATRTMLAAVYRGKKVEYPNYNMYFIDCTKAPQWKQLSGVGHEGLALSLASVGKRHEATGIYGSDFPHGSTGIASLWDGCFYVSEPFRKAESYGSAVSIYRMDSETAEFTLV